MGLGWCIERRPDWILKRRGKPRRDRISRKATWWSYLPGIHIKAAGDWLFVALDRRSWFRLEHSRKFAWRVLTTLLSGMAQDIRCRRKRGRRRLGGRVRVTSKETSELPCFLVCYRFGSRGPGSGRRKTRIDIFEPSGRSRLHRRRRLLILLIFLGRA